MVASAAQNFDAAPALAKAAPTQAIDRIGALDFIRGCALFGILLMNIAGFGLSHAYDNPLNNGGSTGADLWAWIIIQVGFEGTQRALFSVLFGAGIVLLTRRLEATIPAQASDIYMRRNLWLIGFGLFNAWVLLWEGDILFAYGVTALFAYGFRKLPPRWLIAIGLFSMLFIAVQSYGETRENIEKHESAQAAAAVQKNGGKLTDKQQDAIDTWKQLENEHAPTKQKVEEDIRAHRSGWLGTRGAISESIVFLESSYVYRYFGDAFGMMLIGMALFKLGVLTLARPVWLYGLMVLFGYGIGIPVNIAETRWMMSHDFSLISYNEAGITYDVGRLTTMIGHLGALLLFCRSGILPWLRRALSAVGQMALTNYLTHSLVCVILFTGLGLYGQLHRHELYYIWAAIIIPQLIISPIWLRYFRFGPVEWLWRSLTYWKRPAFRRVAVA